MNLDEKIEKMYELRRMILNLNKDLFELHLDIANTIYEQNRVKDLEEIVK